MANVEWQMFCSLTFRSARLPECVRWPMFFQWLRLVGQAFRCPDRKIYWAVRQETGEITGRLHFHALLGNLGSQARQKRSRFRVLHLWDSEKTGLGGSAGHARVSDFDPLRGWADYMEKGLDAHDNGGRVDLDDRGSSRVGGSQYESTKFGSRLIEDLRVSHSVYEAAAVARGLEFAPCC